ncbi:hypothetical protein V6N13_074106 [Hibiscus sabdariffa]
MADEDVGLVHREMSSGERLGELGFMEALRALPTVLGLQGTMGELVVMDSGEQEGIQVPIIEWEFVAAQQSQEVDLGSKSSDSLKHDKY